MAASNFYEVRCENCRTTFPPETKRCIHCGGPLGDRPLRWLGPGAAPEGVPGTEEDEEPVASSRARNVLWLVTVVLALLMSVLRNCMQG
jgi:hypothetical protein